MKSLLLCFALFLGALLQGSPVNFQPCSGPLVTVFGDHYTPPPNCQLSLENEMLRKLSEIKDKYPTVRTAGKSGLEEFFSIGALSSMMEDAIAIFKKQINDAFETVTLCTTCKSGVTSVQIGLAAGKSEDELLGLADAFFCKFLQILSTEICTEYIYLTGPSIVYILNNTDLSPEIVCSFALPKTCDVETPPKLQWKVDLPQLPTSIVAQNSNNFKGGKEVLKILHLADTHVDVEYVEGSWDECDVPQCCRDPLPTETSPRAGKYGGWKCDIPEITFDSLFEFLKTNIPDIDHVFWTGDIPAHDLWNQSKTRNLELIDRTVQKIKNYFPGKNIVLPSLGNHEPIPGNLLPTPTYSKGEWSNDWLYDAITDHWTSNWLSNETTKTIQNGAFYVTEYREGLKMISINSVFCYSNNWWLILDSKDPAEELVWLVDTLAEAEREGDKVHIIAHVPPGYFECLKVWQRNYYRIVERFKNVITGQFFGHTHNDEFELILDDNDFGKTTGVMHIGPSLTSYTYLNPGFRIYYIDGDHENTTRKVLDYETWILDLEESNSIGEPVWKMLYSAKEAFEMESLEPEEWRKVYEKIKTNDEFLERYHRFFWKDSPRRPKCDKACREEYLCNIVSCTQYGNDNWKHIQIF